MTAQTSLTEEDLCYFTGSETLYRHWFLDYKYTEGVRYVAQKGDASWLIDDIIGWQIIPKLRRESFQVWKLTVSSERKAILEATDGNNNRLVRQKIKFTTFPLPEIKLYLIDRILILPSEH